MRVCRLCRERSRKRFLPSSAGGRPDWPLSFRSLATDGVLRVRGLCHEGSREKFWLRKASGWLGSPLMFLSAENV
jgi:hypothetical protein